MNGPIIEKAIWAAQVIQYQLIVTANVGTTTGSDQYDSGETVTISTTAPAAGSGNNTFGLVGWGLAREATKAWTTPRQS